MEASRSLLVLPLMLVLLVASASAAEAKTLGVFKDWTAFVDGQGDKRMCYVASAPQKTEGKYAQRGNPRAVVSHWQKDKVFGEVSIEAGYTYKDGTEVSTDVDGKTFKLFTKGSNAWGHDDKPMVEAMKKGRQMTVTGTSSRGSLTTDTYSLAGFGAAYDAINKACSAK